ncbi:MAG: 3-dehydroquinate synthase II [Methanobrevibacter sp.]|uniref:3-dehydroquinate synthase n=1 Tax=Methanobrevibacter millerae TaxID=230361 RepID=A0A8T3VP88_9EURY|nr:3-dehydroquinate synthase II [Methanobrevibacter sp.]MBE6510228.1 3-dehydroquinate synthase II [Methanobrevibacter millerae]MBO5152669.1 3-dehydroquinate synthase II [Methanobrevibacter sp.]
MQNKFAWIMTPDLPWDDRKEMITTALESGISYVLDLEYSDKIRKLGNVNIISNEDDADIYLVGIGGEGDGAIDLSENLSDSIDLANAKKAKSEGKTVCAYIKITDKLHEQLAVKLGPIVDYIILIGTDWTVIPLENIIADLQKVDVEIIAAVNDSEGAKLALETLEHGTDGVIFEANDFAQIKDIASEVDNASKVNYDLKIATVTNVKPLGSGDRVCVDTTDMMKPGEGMLIGSYSKSLFLVHSESLESEYVASRPFRVNAGPVQAYVMVPGNKTRYLSELVAGDEVLIVNTKGETRTAYVGRSKIERRPLILIEAEYEGKTIRTLLQNAETIRIVDADDKPLSVADVKPGDKVKVYIEKSARHFGIAIDETIIEQ